MRPLVTAVTLGLLLVALGCPSSPKVAQVPAASSSEPIPVGSAAGNKPSVSTPVGGSDEWIDKTSDSLDAVEPDSVPSDLIPDDPAVPEMPEGVQGGGAAVGSDAPPFELTTLDGKKLSSAKLYGNKPVMVTLWATWCGPCVREAPLLNKLHKQYGDEVQFIAISVDNPAALAEVKAFPKKYNVSYPIAHDSSGKLGRSFKADGIPLNVMIGPNGKVIHRVEGLIPESDFRLTFEKAFKVGEYGAKGV